MKYIAVSLVIMTFPIAQGETFRFAVSDFPPFVDQRSPGYGLAPRLVEAALMSQEYHAEFTFMPWPRAYRMTMEGQFDGSFPWSNYSDRERDFSISAPVLEHNISLVFAPNQYRTWQSFQDLNGLHFGTVSGYAIGGDFYDWIATSGQTLETVNDESLLFHMLAYNRFDAAAFDQLAARAFIQKQSQQIPAVSHLVVEEKTIQTGYSYVLMPLESERTERLKAALAEGFKTIRENGTYDSLISEYAP